MTTGALQFIWLFINYETKQLTLPDLAGKVFGKKVNKTVSSFYFSMGILGLSKLLGDYAPSAMKENEFKNYFGKILALFPFSKSMMISCQLDCGYRNVIMDIIL